MSNVLIGEILIGGIGNVLLGDDAIGPYVIRLLESAYSFGDNVEICDLGTPALDLTHRIAGRDVVILVDSIKSAHQPTGSIQLFRKEDILRLAPAPRLDPHSPTLAECLMTVEMLGMTPQHLLLVGVVGACYESGAPLSEPVRQAASKAVEAVVEELNRLDVDHALQAQPGTPDIWWSDCALPHLAERTEV